MSLIDKWKSLRLPWRKRFLAGRSIRVVRKTLIDTGTDLEGNRYYFLRPTLSTIPGPDNRNLRRILQPASQTKTHYSDIVISPAWHQWLRGTRDTAPSLAEQQTDFTRQSQLKVLARAADERWEAKGRLSEPTNPDWTPTVQDEPRRDNFELAVGDGEGPTGSVGMRGRSARASSVLDGQNVAGVPYAAEVVKNSTRTRGS